MVVMMVVVMVMVMMTMVIISIERDPLSPRETMTFKFQVLTILTLC